MERQVSSGTPVPAGERRRKPRRRGKPAVNYTSFETYNREKGKAVYKNSWITGKPVTKENVKLLAERGHARRKTENGNSNVLKNGGYRLEHNTETKFPTDTGKTMRVRYIAF
jgi:hypothetical protein